MTTTLLSTSTDTGTELLERARTFAAILRERAADADAQRTMPADVVATAKDFGLFRLAVPAALGGWEAPPPVIFETIETLAEADGSGAWTTFIGNTTAVLAWLEPDVARDILAGDPDRVAAGTFAPLGRAVPCGDGYTVTGRWPCASGSPHADLLLGGVLVMDGDAPRLRDDGQPDWRFAWFPVSDATVIDTWHAAGLRGTGSHDVEVRGAYVPADRMCAPMFTRARHDGPLYHQSFRNFLSPLMTGFVSGVGRRAVDRFAEIAQRKHRAGGPALADDPHVQYVLGLADTRLRAARALFVDAIADVWRTVNAGDECTLRQRATVIGGSQFVLRAAVGAVNELLPLAGASAVYETEELQRCARDLRAAQHHIFFAPEPLKQVGRVVAGLDANQQLL